MKKKGSELFNEFKKFITKGNVIDMAIGVIIGASFSAIVNSLVQGILMPIITFAIPNGGIDGLVTVLNPNAALPSDTTQNTIQYWGVTYDADVVNIINWGAFINAIINFFAVAIFLFVLLKTYTYLKVKKEKIKANEKEKYYQKHPEARPKPVDPTKPKPTELDVLLEIRDALKSNSNSSSSETKE